MNNYTQITANIKDRISMQEVAQFYGLTFNRSGFAVCPFHEEDTPSFKIYKTDAHCFGCGWHGDMIAFVIALFGVSFTSALDKINDDFNLNLPLHRRLTLREQREAQERYKTTIAEKERREAEKKAYDSQYQELWDEWFRLDKNRAVYAPKTPDEDPHPLYVEALQKISYQEYLIDTLL